MGKTVRRALYESPRRQLAVVTTFATATLFILLLARCDLFRRGKDRNTGSVTVTVKVFK